MVSGIKLLSLDLNPFIIAFYRCLFGVIVILPFMIFTKYGSWKTNNLKLQFLRGSINIYSMISWFIAIGTLQLEKAAAIGFTTPLFTTLLAVLILGEVIKIHRITALIIGFIGILVITEPGISSLNIYYIFPIIFCLGLSYVAIAIRQLSTTEPVWLISFYFSLSITLLSFLTIPYGWVMPDLKDFLILSMIGIFGGVANLWLGQSYKYSEVSLVTPLKYLALLFAIIFGYFIWNEIPTIKTLFGALLVIVSTMIIFRREIYNKKLITSKTVND